MRTLVGSVGYHNLSDLSAGPMVLESLMGRGLPEDVAAFDLSYGGPIATVHRLREARPPFERVVIVGAVERDGTDSGYRWYRWHGKLPPEDEIQTRVAEAVTGVLDFDSFPIIAQQFGALPDDVRIVEIQPIRTGAGLETSPEVGRLLPEVCELVRRLAVEESGELA